MVVTSFQPNLQRQETPRTGLDRNLALSYRRGSIAERGTWTRTGPRELSLTAFALDYGEEEDNSVSAIGPENRHTSTVRDHAIDEFRTSWAEAHERLERTGVARIPQYSGGPSSSSRSTSDSRYSDSRQDNAELGVSGVSWSIT